MIEVKPHDTGIWNIDDVVCSIIAGERHLFLAYEGPCATHIGLYSWLDKLCSSLKIDKHDITIETNNLIESHPEYNIVIRGNHFVSFAKDISTPATKNNKVEPFGLFVGRSTWDRLYLVSKLFDKSSYVTYHYNFSTDTYYEPGLDRYIFNVGKSSFNNAVNLLSQSPILLDESVKKLPILFPEHNEICKYYTEFLFDVVAETFTSGNTFFPTEKTWRPIIMQTPFIVHGPYGYLNNLKKIGFQTFSQWIDESYDSAEGAGRIDAIHKEVHRISRMSNEQLCNMYHDMIPILEYNYNLCMEQTPESILQKFING